MGLFPGVNTPVRNTGTPSSFDKGEESDADLRTEKNPVLKNRGMKFIHVNAITLPVLLTRTGFCY